MYNNRATYVNKSEGDFHLVDSYDSEDSNLYDFFNKQESLDILTRTYEKLCKSDVRFLELTMQPFEYLGKFSVEKSFTDGNDAEQINQTIDGDKFFTTLKAVQLNDETARFFDLTDDMKKLKKCIDTTENISILLGNAYHNKMEIGDEFDILYLGGKKIHCKVVGFLRNNAKITLDGNDINLNHYILSRSIRFAEQDSNDYKKILLSVKCEGYIHYDSIKQRKESIDFIKELKKTTGYAYVIPRIEIELNTIMNVAELSYLILLISVILLSSSIYKILTGFFEKYGSSYITVLIVTAGIALEAFITLKIAISIFTNHINLIQNATVAYIIMVGVVYFVTSVFVWNRRGTVSNSN